MKPMYYYNGELVSDVRFYQYGGQSRVEFTLHGKRINVRAREVTTERNINNDNIDTKKDNIEKNESVMESEEVVEQETDHKVDEEAEVKEEIETEAEPESALIKVIDLDGAEDEGVYELDSQEFITLVEKHKWDTQAIERVLNGEQKTHKGYAFELV